MKLISWNVNGIRSVLGKGFADFVTTAGADVICLQEVKARQEQAGAVFDGYEVLWNAAERPGYSGTAILTKVAPLDVRLGIGCEEHDREGRVLTVEFADFFFSECVCAEFWSGVAAPELPGGGLGAGVS